MSNQDKTLQTNLNPNPNSDTASDQARLIDERDLSPTPKCAYCGHVHMTRATVIDAIKTGNDPRDGVMTHRRITMCHVGGCASDMASRGGVSAGINMVPPHWHDKPKILQAFMTIMDTVASNDAPMEPIDVLDVFAAVIINLSLSVPNETVVDAMDGLREVVIGKHRQINEILAERRQTSVNDDCAGAC